MTESIGFQNRLNSSNAISDSSQISNDSDNIINTSNNTAVEAPPELEGEGITAGMLEQLNRLLGRATKETFGNVNPDTLDNILSQKSMEHVMAKVGGVAAVKELAEEAKRLMGELDKLKDITDYDKLFEARDPQEPLPLHIQAMNAQFKLSDKLRDILNRMQGSELTDEQYAILEEMQFKCDARAAEISRWAVQMNTLYDEQKNQDPSLQRQAKSKEDGFSFATPVGQALAELSGKMHGTLDGLLKLASSNKQVFEFLHTLEEFKKSGDTGKVSDQEYQKLETSALAMQRALEEIAERGLDVNGLEDKNGTDDRGQQPSTGSWLLDPETMKVLASNVAKSLDVNLLHKGALLEVASRIIENELGLPDFFQALKEIPTDILQNLGIGTDSFECLFKAERTVYKAMMDYVANPTPEEKQKMQDDIQRTLEALPYDDLLYEIREVCSSARSIMAKVKQQYQSEPKRLDAISNKLAPLLAAGNEYKKDRKNFVQNNKDFLFLQDDGGFYKHKIKTVMRFLEGLALQDDSQKLKTVQNFKTKAFLESVFHGEYPVSSLVEIRLHGVADEDIQTEAVDTALQDSKVLGKGAANEVMLCTYRNGNNVNKYVFKPELPGEWGVSELGLTQGKAYSRNIKIYNLNIASRKCAELFGLQDCMVTSKAGMLKGKFGFFMSVAPGKTFDNLEENSTLKQKLTANINAKKDKLQLQKNMVFQFNELQWLDLLTGQGDRHGGNLMMNVVSLNDNSQISLKGIDNDLCFSEHRVGVNKYILTPEQHDEMKDNFSGLEPVLDDVTIAAAKKLWKECIVKQSDGTYLMDVDKMQENNNPYLILCAHYTVGFQSSTMPTYITQKLYEKLQQYKNDKNARQEMVSAMQGKHLSHEALDAMSKRLDELTAHAEKLQKNGMVIGQTENDWVEVLKKSRNMYKQQMNSLTSEVPFKDPSLTSYLGRCEFIMAGDYYFKFIVANNLEPKPTVP